MHAWDCACGVRNAPSFNHCRDCKKPVQQGKTILYAAQKRCRRCGSVEAGASLFCSKCQYSFTGKKPAKPAQPPPKKAEPVAVPNPDPPLPNILGWECACGFQNGIGRQKCGNCNGGIRVGCKPIYRPGYVTPEMWFWRIVAGAAACVGLLMFIGATQPKPEPPTPSAYYTTPATTGTSDYLYSGGSYSSSRSRSRRGWDGAPKTQSVRGYTRRDGTRVSGYRRRPRR